ncbi:Protein FAR1-RELATED SEQUENCE 12 [Capsicum annuum]|nr:Protein FAR1-RELATED SEQUENCE 12 [Capsicum annuum]
MTKTTTTMMRKERQMSGLEFDMAEDAQEWYSDFATKKRRRFQTSSRTGCPAFIRVQRVDSGKWVLANVNEEHNYAMENAGAICVSKIVQRKVIDGTVKLNQSRLLDLDQLMMMVCLVGLVFLILRGPREGGWLIVFTIEHNHELGPPGDVSDRVSLKGFKEEGSCELENMDLAESNGGLSLVSRSRESKIGSDWYNEFSDYFQARQAEDLRFFYAVEMHKGRAMSVLWADSRSRFACTQFGDVIVFDTTYRKGSCLVPLASFIGINHHRQPVLLGCALVVEDSEESFTWVFQAWPRAMSGRCPVYIVSDQDRAIQHSIAQVFPGTHHRFSPWQVVEKEQETIGALRPMNPEFKYLVQKCGNGDERNTVAFNVSNLNISCSCKMFEFEGVLCRHALKVFKIMNIRELPSRYIVHRWTKDAKYGILCDVDSGGTSQDYKALMFWSLREEAKNYIETGTTSLER